MILIAVSFLFTKITYATDTLKESYTVTTDFTDWIATTKIKCQTFTTTSAHTIDAISVWIYRNSTGSGTGYIKLYATDVNHKPTGSELASGNIDVDSLPETTTETKLTISSYSAQNATEYAICLSAPNADHNTEYLGYAGKATGTYADGTFVFSNDSGSTWNVDTADMQFKIYSTDTTPPTEENATTTDDFLYEKSNYPAIFAYAIFIFLASFWVAKKA